MKQRSKDSVSVVGIGAAACVACCAGPILALLGGVSLAGLASTLVIGLGGLAIAAVALIALLIVRRHRAADPMATKLTRPRGRADPPTRPTTEHSMRLIPIYDASAPIVCTIGDDEAAERVALLERLRQALDHVERTEHGLLLRFSDEPAIAADVRRFSVEEKRCCQFWGFEVGSRSGELTLRWDGPPGAADVLDRLHAYFLGDESLTAVTGLL